MSYCVLMATNSHVIFFDPFITDSVGPTLINDIHTTVTIQA